MNEHLFNLVDIFKTDHSNPNKTTTYVYTYEDGRRIMWNIDEALRIIKNKPREPRILIDSGGQFKRIHDEFDLEPIKLKNADCTIPVIIAPIIAEGKLTLIPIDGLHRMAKAYENNFDVYGYLLDIMESRQCILACSEGCVP